jgi:hypothetical protein
MTKSMPAPAADAFLPTAGEWTFALDHEHRAWVYPLTRS